MIILDSACVEEHLKSTDCVELMEKTLYELAEGSCVQYLRTAINLPNTNVLGLMPGWFDGYFGVKTISVYHTNRGSGYPSHQGQILLFESEHGSLLAGIDATSVTKIRTGAVSAVATRLLARPDSSRLCILGCGAQGESHIDAIVPFFDIKRSLYGMLSLRRQGHLPQRQVKVPPEASTSVSAIPPKKPSGTRISSAP